VSSSNLANSQNHLITTYIQNSQLSQRYLDILLLICLNKDQSEDKNVIDH
jgi:hypothetical protein